MHFHWNANIENSTNIHTKLNEKKNKEKTTKNTKIKLFFISKVVFMNVIFGQNYK